MGADRDTSDATRVVSGETERLLDRLRKVLADPGSVTPRDLDDHEPLYRWQARAVLDALGLEQVGWRIGNGIGQEGSWYANHGEPVYTLHIASTTPEEADRG